MATISRGNPCLFITTVAHSPVEYHSNGLPVFSESFFMQKVSYIHFNPIKAGLEARAEEHRWSSAQQ
jgi:REP element-mobilizing transposase RayT